MKTFSLKILVATSFVMIVSTLTNCGSNKSDTSSSSSADISGTIVSQTGAQAEMQGWIIVMQEKDSGICRVSEISSSGVFNFKAARIGIDQTLILLSPNFKRSSVLSFPGSAAGKIRQYFRTSLSTLPRIIHEGPIIKFFSNEGITTSEDAATDGDGDLIPDGVDTAKGLVFKLLEDVDSDADGIINLKDVDIDGDGVSNEFDSDDDGDGTLDIFDSDSDGDNVDDATGGTTGDLYYEDGVEFVSIQMIQTPETDGTNSITLKFTAKLRAGVSPLAAQVRGQTSLLTGAVVTSDGSNSTWDLKLNDDGNNGDDSANDGHYARTIKLGSGKTPTQDQVLFIQLAFGSAENPWFKEYAYTFPTVTLGSVAASYDKSTRTITVSGKPFDSVTTYKWSAIVYDSSNIKVHSSPILPGATTTYQIPANILDSSVSYKTVVFAQSLDRVPSYPAYVIKSSEVNLQ